MRRGAGFVAPGGIGANPVQEQLSWVGSTPLAGIRRSGGTVLTPDQLLRMPLEIVLDDAVVQQFAQGGGTAGDAIGGSHHRPP